MDKKKLHLLMNMKTILKTHKQTASSDFYLATKLNY